MIESKGEKNIQRWSRQSRPRPTPTFQTLKKVPSLGNKAGLRAKEITAKLGIQILHAYKNTSTSKREGYFISIFPSAPLPPK